MVFPLSREIILKAQNYYFCNTRTPFYVFQQFQNLSKIDYKSGTKWYPGWNPVKIELQTLQNAPKTPQDCQRRSQDGPKMAPRRFQDAPKMLKDAPRPSQTLPNHQNPPPDDDYGTIFGRF